MRQKDEDKVLFYRQGFVQLGSDSLRLFFRDFYMGMTEHNACNNVSVKSWRKSVVDAFLAMI